MAPQVGLEPTTLRLTAGQCASCSLILKAFLAVQGRHNRCTWGFGSTNCSTIYPLNPEVRKPSANGASASERMPQHRREGRLQFPHLPVALGSPSEIPLPLLV